VRIPRAPRDLILLGGHEPFVPLAHVHGPDCRAREAIGYSLWSTLGALLADVPHTRPVARDGLRDRPGARHASEPPAVLLRGARPEIVGVLTRRLPHRRPALREPVGGGAALHRRLPQPEGVARAESASSRAWSASSSTPVSWRARSQTTSARSMPPSSTTLTSRRSSRSSRRPRVRTSPTTSSSPRVTRSSATSSASCASAGRNHRADAAGGPAGALCLRYAPHRWITSTASRWSQL